MQIVFLAYTTAFSQIEYTFETYNMYWEPYPSRIFFCMVLP